MFALQHSAIGADVASQWGGKKKESQHVLMGENEQYLTVVPVLWLQ